MSYDNTNTGVLFKERDKKSDRHPDYSGNINVNGEEFFLSAWIKEAKTGRKFMSLSVKPKTEKKDTRTLAERKRPPQDDLDDVPFASADAGFDMEPRHLRRMRRYG